MSKPLFLMLLSMCLIATTVVLRPLVHRADARNKGHARTGLLAAIVVVLSSVALYAAIGRPDAASRPAKAAGIEHRGTASSRPGKIGSVTSMLSGLEERMRENPDDGKGWLLLAKSYHHLGRPDDAKHAYEQATALGYADVTLAGSLSTTSAENSDVAEIRGSVTLSSAAGEMVSESDTVFVIAKAAGGSRVPLAVLRKSAAELPFDFVLNDSLSMVQGNALSASETVVVTVKISSSGDALHTNAGMEVSSRPVSTRNSEAITLHIDPQSTPGGDQC